MAPSFLLSRNAEVATNACEFIPNKLYLSSVSQQLSVDKYPDTHFFAIDHILVYMNFYADFGPNNISHVFRFIDILGQKFKTVDKSICLVTSSDDDKRTNGAYLMCFYMMLVYKLSPEEAYAPIAHEGSVFLPYRDAGYGPATYHITILDCLQGFYKALQIGLFHVDAFNTEEYEYYEKVENGDFNWLTDKFIAICSPKDDVPGQLPIYGASQNAPNPYAPSVLGKSQNKQVSKFFPVTRIDGLIKYCKAHNVQTIVRLNNKLYDRKRFVDAGLQHVDMYFPDGSNPPENILLDFLELSETTEGSIAVHCKAGLGRTGSLIAAYMMKHHKMTASEIISFLRIMRPGSVVGPQQNWLEEMQEIMWKMHPKTKLSPTYSLMKPSTLDSYCRFQIYAEAYPTLQKINLNFPAKIMNEDVEMMDVEVPVTKKPKSISKNSTIMSHFKIVKNNNMLPRSFSEKEGFGIPIQPRKGHDGSNGDAEEPIGQDFSPDHRYNEYAIAAQNAKIKSINSISDKLVFKAPTVMTNSVSGKMYTP